MRTLNYAFEGKPPGLHLTQRCFHWLDEEKSMLYPSCDKSAVILSNGYLSKCPKCNGKVFIKETKDELAVDVMKRLNVK